MSSDLSRSSNHILAALAPEEYGRLAPHLEPVTLALSDVLFRPGEALAHAYFPSGAIVSLLTELEGGGGMEVGLVGAEGLVGISVVLGGEETKVATVQGAGDALRVLTGPLREEFARGGRLHEFLLRYTHALMAQISQSVVCNVRHHIPGRLARWLLMYADRSPRRQFELTQEFMSNMLGVRRAGVSEAAEELQRRGLIQYQRGSITITDRAGLEAYACECYDVVKHVGGVSI